MAKTRPKHRVKSLSHNEKKQQQMANKQNNIMPGTDRIYYKGCNGGRAGVSVGHISLANNAIDSAVTELMNCLACLEASQIIL